MFQGKITNRWRKKSTTTSSPLFFFFSKPFLLLLLLSLFLFLLCFTYSSTLRSLLQAPASTTSLRSPLKPPPAQFPQCANSPLGGERFLFYAPHSGFSNQLSVFRNAIVMAAILNRTVIVPPVLDHHAVALGSCPKFRVSSPNELRGSVWDHIMELVRSRRYVSMADIVDLPPLVKTIDFRVFASMWCDLAMDHACSSWGSLPTNFKQCRSLLSGLEGNIRNCIYAVEEDCRTTVWTYGQNDDGTLDSFQPHKELRRKKKISYVRRHRDVSYALGLGSEAETSTVLSFGSLFSAPYKGSELYIDIKAPSDSRMLSLLEKIEFLPFVPEIRKAGKFYAVNKIKEPFLCAQLRLLDGQFKNHWKTTFSKLKQKIQSLQVEYKNNKASGPITIFVMTDLPSANWTGSNLADLVNDCDSFKLYTLKDGDDFLLQTAKNLRDAKHGLRSSFMPVNHDIVKKIESCELLLPDISLYLEETLCSCASLGFVGTSGSTIAENIELMRKNDNCIMSKSS